MAQPRSTNGVTLTYPATTAYKQWVRVQMKARGWTQQRLVDELKRKAKSDLVAIVDRKGRSMYDTITTATISDFLGPEDVTPEPSNSKLLPAFNKVFGIAPPPVCDPTDELSQVRDLFADRWKQMTPAVQRAILELLGKTD